MAGFCPYGPDCKKRHLKPVIIDEIATLKQLANFPDSENWPKPNQEKINNQRQPMCYHCGEKGHKSTHCQKDKIEQDELDKIIHNQRNSVNGQENIKCFNCY